jgi:ferredoxin-nitrite reductase
VPDGVVAEAETAIRSLGLDTKASAVRGALVACTGNTGCKFAATDTKGQAMRLAAHLEARLALDRPVNIHLTGCPNSCAQHYVGDIGLLGLKLGDDMLEGYSVLLGGGAGSERALAREIYPAVPATELPACIERILRGYLAYRDGGESFHDFAARHSLDALRAMFETVG